MVLVVLASAGVFLVAPVAAGAAELDSKRLAKQVAATVAPAYPDLPIGFVKCPNKIARKAGTVVICDADAGGYSLQFRVTQTDRTGGVTIESTDAYIVRPPGFTFACTARFNDGTVQQVSLSPTDVAGNTTITQVS